MRYITFAKDESSQHECTSEYRAYGFALDGIICVYSYKSEITFNDEAKANNNAEEALASWKEDYELTLANEV